MRLQWSRFSLADTLPQECLQGGFDFKYLDSLTLIIFINLVAKLIYCISLWYYFSNNCHPLQKTLGLVIDLTNTSRFYNKNELEEAGIQYMKINCKG